MDIKMDFLNGHFEENICMVKLHDFMTKEHDNKVWNLQKVHLWA